jgi:hypothetical protein
MQRSSPFQIVDALLAPTSKQAVSSVLRLRLRKSKTMLVLIVTIAIIGSFVVEYLVHLFRNNYEIEWIIPSEQEKSASAAQEIINVMRKTHRESERQMNKAFKVASDRRW